MARQYPLGYIDLPFKGDRDYLRFADIIPALMNVVSDSFGQEATVESITVRKPFRSRIAVTLWPVESASGWFLVRDGTHLSQGWLLETGQEITTRIALDTSLVARWAVVTPETVEITRPVPGLTIYDILVSLMKILAEHVETRHWWLCQIRLSESLMMSFPLAVRSRRIIGRQFIEFEIFQGGRLAGTSRLVVDAARV